MRSKKGKHLDFRLKRSLSMSENIIGQLFKHNNWANLRIIQACSLLGDEQLDAKPASATKGSIRVTLWHLVAAQQNYLSLLTGGNTPRSSWQAPPPLAELSEAANTTGEALLAMAKDEPGTTPKTRLQTKDGKYVEPWVVMVQVINHATEHREQICSMLSSLGLTPPDLDGWSYGEATNALVPIPK
jgi:uncharacterized damage-inducible protein DinB